MTFWKKKDYLENMGSPHWGTMFHTMLPEITGNIEINTERPQFKFDEDVVLDLMKDYIGETYTKHYVSKGKFQTLDFIQALGDAKGFCRGNAMKYLSRYDKKGTPTLDIKKAMHYCVLLYYFYTMEEASK